MMIWRKPTDLKFTQLCIYVDENVEKLREPGQYPVEENTIYNYLWLVIKALAIKKCMFQNFEDYDGYTFYAANRIYFALRKNLWNQGKVVKGKLIRPIKSCLNYIKALMYPMKIEYLQEAYREIIDAEYTSKKFDAIKFKQQLLDGVKSSAIHDTMLESSLADLFKDAHKIINTILDKSPWAKNSAYYERLKISVLLSCKKSLSIRGKLTTDGINTIILWRLPKTMLSYVKTITKEFYTELQKQVIDCVSSFRMSDEEAEQIITYKEGADYEYDNDQY